MYICIIYVHTTLDFPFFSGAWSDGDSKWKSVDHDTKKEMGLHYMYVQIDANLLKCSFWISGMTASFGWSSSMTFVVNLRYYSAM